MKHIFFALLLLTGTVFAQEDKLLDLLKSNASPKEKADACRELARIGTRQAVPVLAPLLADENLSHMACYALEPIADPAASAALREALGTLKGRWLAGVIRSLGVRKDREAVELLARYLNDSDPVVAEAAARALGNIGGAAALALEIALASGSANRLAVCEGLFRCAEEMAGPEATVIYDKVRAIPNLPHHLRVAALRGAIQSRGTQGLPLLSEAIRTESYVPAIDAIGISMEMPGAEVTRTLVAELAQANKEKQVLLLQALGNRGDVTAAPALESLAQSGPVNRRIAAIRSLVQLGPPSLVPKLVGWLKDPNTAVSSAAQTGLFGFPGKEADAAVVALVSDPDTKIRIAAIESASQRRITTAVPVLLNTTRDADAGVSGAGFKALGELGRPADIPSMVDALLQTNAVTAAETALSAICARQSDPATCTELLLPSLAKARGEPKLALLRVLGTIGDPKALAAVRSAAADPDAAIKETALRVLCEWPNVHALSDLAQLSRTASEPKFRILALQGQLRLIPMQNVSDAQKLSQVKELLPLIERPDERRLVLTILGGLPSVESLAMITPYLTSEGLQEEAGSAAVVIAEKIVATHPADVVAAMKKVQTKDKNLAARVEALLKR